MEPQNPNQPDNLRQQVPPPQTPPTRQLRTPIIVLLAIFLLSAVGLGAYFLGKNQTNQTQIAQPSPTPTPDPTAGWKTYTNTQYGYSIKFPQNLLHACTIQGGENDFYLYDKTDICGSGEISPQLYIIKYTDTNAFFKTDPCYSIEQENMIIGGINAIKYSSIRTGSIPPCIGPLKEVRIVIPSKLLEVFISEIENKNIKYQILSTLKFTK